MAREPHFQIVRTDGGHFVRYVAANNRIVWVTPGLFARRAGAVNAIEALAGRFVYVSPFQAHPEIEIADRMIEVRDVDERGVTA